MHMVDPHHYFLKPSSYQAENMPGRTKRLLTWWRCFRRLETLVTVFWSWLVLILAWMCLRYLVSTRSWVRLFSSSSYCRLLLVAITLTFRYWNAVLTRIFRGGRHSQCGRTGGGSAPLSRFPPTYCSSRGHCCDASHRSVYYAWSTTI